MKILIYKKKMICSTKWYKDVMEAFTFLKIAWLISAPEDDEISGEKILSKPVYKALTFKNMKTRKRETQNNNKLFSDNNKELKWKLHVVYNVRKPSKTALEIMTIIYGLVRKHKWWTRKDNNYRAWMERYWRLFLSKTYWLYQIMFKEISFKARQKRCLKQHERGEKPMNYHEINSMIFAAKEDNAITR